MQGVKILAGILFLSFLVSGCATTRQDTALRDLQLQMSDMKSQLKSKDDEIQELRYEVQNLNSQLSVTRPSSNRSFQTSESGDAAEEPSKTSIQLALKNAGFYEGPVDGKIGQRTKAAVEEFQKAHALKVDGKVGKQTWAELKAYLK